MDASAGIAPPRLVARGPLAERCQPRGPAPAAAGDRSRRSTCQGLLAAHAIGAGGPFAPPWLKEGWFHAYLLQAPAIDGPRGPPGRRGRSTGASPRSPTTARRSARTSSAGWSAARGRAASGPSLGYTVRREPFNSEFSQGIENIALGFPAGLQLRDLRAHRQAQGFSVERLAARSAWPARATAAWNPVAGFTDRARPAALGRGRRSRPDPGRPTRPGSFPHRAVPAQVAVAGPSALRDPRGRAAARGGDRRAAAGREGEDREGPRDLSPLGLGGPRQHARLGRRRALSVRLRRALGRPARARPRRARSRGRGGHRDRAPGPRRRAAGEGRQRGAALQRHHVHLRGAGGGGLPQRGDRRPAGAGRAGPALERRCPGT